MRKQIQRNLSSQPGPCGVAGPEEQSGSTLLHSMTTPPKCRGTSLIVIKGSANSFIKPWILGNATKLNQKYCVFYLCPSLCYCHPLDMTFANVSRNIPAALVHS